MTFKKLLLISILALAILLPVFSATAQDNPCPPGTPDLKKCLTDSLNQTGGEAGYGKTAGAVEASTISQKIGTIISYVLAFLGVIFLILVVYSGLQWMMAGGNEEKVKQARTRLINAAVGLIIVLSAYAITFFVVSKIQKSVNVQQEQANANDCHQNNNDQNCVNDRYQNQACVWLDNGPGTPGVCCNADEQVGQGRCIVPN